MGSSVFMLLIPPDSSEFFGFLELTHFSLLAVSVLICLEENLSPPRHVPFYISS